MAALSKELSHMSPPTKLAKYVVVAALALMSTSIAATKSMAGEMDGIMMSGGKMVVMQNGKRNTTLDKSVTMSDGTRVRPDGSIQMKDGTESRLRQGEMIMMDGHIMRGGKASAMCH
jgi:hypothetical protein